MDKKGLLDFVCQVLHIEKCTELILKQINKYVTERGYEYIDSARALSYFVDVQGKTPQLQYGIGIVPFIIDDAKKYFENLRRQKEEQLLAAQRSKNSASPTTIHCVIKSSKPKKPRINIEDL